MTAPTLPPPVLHHRVFPAAARPGTALAAAQLSPAHRHHANRRTARCLSSPAPARTLRGARR